jgi:tripartite-type tricarboxylate transporter receptor subunit TctC
VVGVSVVVDNISGAAGMTGNIRVARSAPDGYTLLLNGSTDITAQLTFKPEVPFSLDDIAYIGGFFDSPTWVLSHKDRGYADLTQVLDKAKAEPGTLTIGTAGPTQTLMAAAIRGITGADIRIVPFAGGADLRPAMIGNQVDVGIFHAPVMLAEVREGLINVVGTGRPLGKITYPPVRGTKTLKDIDIPVEFSITRGIFVPRKTPPDIVVRLSELVEKAATSDTFAKHSKTFGFAPVWIPGPEFEKQVRAELAMFKDIKAKYIDK